MIQRVAIGLLALLALVMGVNLVSATSRFVTAYDTYDRIALELTEFTYVDAQQPVETQFVVGNPTRQTVEVIAIELALSAGVHRVGGGELRTQDRLVPGSSKTYTIHLHIFDRDYMERNITGDVDWRVRGRIMVQLDPAIEPEWIRFVVRYVPE
jgi:hypothetical protein